MQILSRSFIIFILTFSIGSCTAQNNNTPYTAGKTFSFELTVTDSMNTILIMDTLDVLIKSKSIIGGILGMNQAEWNSTKFPNIKNKRGINLKEGFAEIQMPLNYNYLENENIVIAGYPSYSEDMKVKHSTQSEHYFVKGYGKLKGLKIDQYSEVMDSVKVFYKDKERLCKVRKYKNISHIKQFGQYHLKTYYDMEYGFIQMLFQYPNGKELNFKLIEIR